LSLFSNILVVGGNARLPGFRERLYVAHIGFWDFGLSHFFWVYREADVRAMAPAHFEVKIQPLGTEYGDLFFKKKPPPENVANFFYRSPMLASWECGKVYAKRADYHKHRVTKVVELYFVGGFLVLQFDAGGIRRTWLKNLAVEEAWRIFRKICIIKKNKKKKKKNTSFFFGLMPCLHTL
jgi:hypothetical protein